MKITEIRTTPLALKYREPYHWAGRVDLGGVNLLIEAETDEGLIGYGETTAARPAEAAIAALQGIGPLFVGESPFQIERLMSRARWLGGFSHNPRFANLTPGRVEAGEGRVMPLNSAIGFTNHRRN